MGTRWDTKETLVWLTCKILSQQSRQDFSNHKTTTAAIAACSKKSELRNLRAVREESCYLTQTNLKLTVLLPQSPKCWEYRRGTMCLTLFPTIISQEIFLKIFWNLWDSSTCQGACHQPDNLSSVLRTLKVAGGSHTHALAYRQHKGKYVIKKICILIKWKDMHSVT